MDAYVYDLAQAGCDDEHNGNGWYGLLRGHLDVSATARLEYPLSDDEVDFLSNQVGAIVHEYAEGQYHVTYYASTAGLETAWRTVTAGARPRGPQPEL